MLLICTGEKLKKNYLVLGKIKLRKLKSIKEDKTN